MAEAAEERYRLEAAELLTAGNDAPDRGLAPAPPGVCYRGKNVRVRSALN